MTAARKRFRVKEIFSTLQGEGVFCGVPSTFVRFCGCNMWSGLEKDRGNGNPCAAWCDTDFVGGDWFSSEEILNTCRAMGNPHVVLTGGEPLLQATPDLISSLKQAGMFVAIETNGTQALMGRDPSWVSCSPKTSIDKIAIERINELKVCYPSFHPNDYVALHTRMPQVQYRIFLQPIDGVEESLGACLSFIREHKEYRLSAQCHKMWGIR
jgi:7-carboxy-7-deazaguanine synthase